MQSMAAPTYEPVLEVIVKHGCRIGVDPREQRASPTLQIGQPLLRPGRTFGAGLPAPPLRLCCAAGTVLLRALRAVDPIRWRILDRQQFGSGFCELIHFGGLGSCRHFGACSIPNWRAGPRSEFCFLRPSQKEGPQRCGYFRGPFWRTCWGTKERCRRNRPCSCFVSREASPRKDERNQVSTPGQFLILFFLHGWCWDCGGTCDVVTGQV